MSLDFATLAQLKKQHPAWKLLQAEHAPLIASFLHRAFIVPNQRVMAQSAIVSQLEDYLYNLRAEEGEDKFPRDSEAYLDEWSKNDKGWLRQFYPRGSDEPHYDLTPATEKALVWLENLTEKKFVGTESRLLMIFELLRQMVSGTTTDPQVRLAELTRRKEEIDAQIESLKRGEMTVMDETAVRDRFQQVQSTARELLSDFRTVEHNFRELDRAAREQIASWDGKKGALLQKIFGARDAIADSDQGKSFRAFWDFLMSPASQEELTYLLEHVFGMEALNDTGKDLRFKRIHFDWLEAGEYTQRTVAKLSEQLRRYLDDQAYLENKRIIELLNSINVNAIKAKGNPPEGPFMTVDEAAPTLFLPMEKPLYSVAIKAKIKSEVAAGEAHDFVPELLFNQVTVDKRLLISNIGKACGSHEQVSLKQVIDKYPLSHGLAELVAYFSLAAASKRALIDEEVIEAITWEDADSLNKIAHMPRILYPKVL